MRRAAGEIAAAPDLPSAAAIAPRLVRTCSNCHESSNAVVTFAYLRFAVQAIEIHD